MATGMFESFDMSEREFQLIRDLVYEQSGIYLGDNKKELVRTRLAKRMRKEGFASYREYYDAVLADESGKELVALLDAVATNLTSFYREEKHFDYLVQKVLPELVKEKMTRGDRRLRVWSAGCSTGEEPYTIALILLKEIPDVLSWDAKILATDISTKVLDLANNGVYHKDKIQSVPKDLLLKYFVRTHDKKEQDFYQVGPELRQLVSVKRLNLNIARYPFQGKFDFIFCRNVMIYFDKPTQQTLINRFYDCLEPGGHLFIGHSESLTGIKHKFNYLMPTVYQKERKA